MKRVALAVIAALMAGCSLQPVYERPAAPVAATYPIGDAYQSPSAGSGTSLAVDIGWRDFLTDPRLRRLVEIALANNRDLRVTALNVEQMQAQYRITRSALFPQVGVFADSSATRTPASLSTTGTATVLHDYSVGLQASWENDFFGRVRS
jgi:multidrug efflux system outer membrane protein